MLITIYLIQPKKELMNVLNDLGQDSDISLN